ncbi:MAG: hypothetical protein ACYTG0_47555 [Planctomycetota bacterium]|jgi:hypothetical protein
MANENGGTLRAVAWSEVCPWLNLVRCFRLAIRFRLLLLSAVAVLLTVGGWALLLILFSGNPDIKEQIRPYEEDPTRPWSALPRLVQAASIDLVPEKPQLPNVSLGLIAENLGADFSPEDEGTLVDRTGSSESAGEPFWASFRQLSRPLRQIFASDVTGTKLAFLLLCGLWALAVWGFFGGAITRVAAVELAREERVGWGEMMRHTRSKWRAYFAAPLFPLVAVLIGSAMVGVLGLLIRSDVGLLITALVWPLVLLGGFLTIVLLLGLALGWPLMWATVSTEGTDSFDALARSYSYVFQRPLQYLFYAVVAVVLGVLGWLVVSNFAAAVTSVAYWAVDWGADSARWSGDGGRAIGKLLEEDTKLGLLGGIGAGLLVFWTGCVKMLAVGFLYSYFWTASTAIYFLLRRDAEATEMDEVFLEEDEEEPVAGLPPINTDEAGAPVVSDDAQPPADERETPAPEPEGQDDGSDQTSQ